MIMNMYLYFLVIRHAKRIIYTQHYNCYVWPIWLYHIFYVMS